MPHQSLQSLITTVAIAVACLAAFASEVSADKRFFTIAAVEPKGGATTDKNHSPRKHCRPVAAMF